jgi:hypothetical protein
VCSRSGRAAARRGRQSNSPSTRRCVSPCLRPLGEVGVEPLRRPPAARAADAAAAVARRIARRSRRSSAARSARRSRGSAACRASRTAGAGSGRSRSASRPCSCGRRGWCAARSPPSAGCRRWRRRPARRRLHELARVGVQRFEVAPLALVEEDVEGERDLPLPDTPVITVKRSRGISTSMFFRLCSRAWCTTIASLRAARGAAEAAGAAACAGWGRDLPRSGREALRSRAARARCASAAFARITSAGVPARRCAAGVAAFRAEVDDPVGGADHVEVVLDHEQRVAGGEQLAEGAQQLGDVVEVQAGGRLVEQEQRCRLAAAPGTSVPRSGGRRASAAAPRRPTASAPAGRASGSRGRRRPAAAAARASVVLAGEERERLGDGHLEHVGDERGLFAPRAMTSSTSARSAGRRSRGSAGRRRTGTASRRARSRCRRRSGSGRCRS